ncbi:MAG: hypothetical protein Q9190_002525 [Brigantiaea leucoxantha]
MSVVVHMSFETNDERLKGLKEGIFVATGRHIFLNKIFSLESSLSTDEEYTMFPRSAMPTVQIFSIHARAVDNKTTSSNSLSLLRLPFGARLEIYRNLLVSKDTVHMKQNSSDYPGPKKLFPAILRTCRRVYFEAIDVLYGDNLFLAHRINERNHCTALIKRISLCVAVEYPDQPDYDVGRLLLLRKNYRRPGEVQLDYWVLLFEDSVWEDEVGKAPARTDFFTNLMNA